MGLKTADFDFPLPPDRIAQHPAKPRDSARLLVVGAGFADRSVRDPLVWWSGAARQVTVTVRVVLDVLPQLSVTVSTMSYDPAAT
jgi:hypothetical protein